ncbi:OLC1v1032208C1 [Oldenlandia corymbosa var. corymbosa]|uniref:Elongator complex protein 2 n=1 Tax=Oldenlandia corymbosa var. corymbosa TaxID=529605 RepID=A0AAV1CM11_OLDCO|nr:OLC1v1032208C1 [Oldenlandia corymbosa var. corymbosa]
MGSKSDGVEAKVERVFIGAGCNRVVNNVSWGACDLVSFGAQNALAIFCPKIAQILTTLPGHKASVNCTYWLPNSKFAFKAKDMERHFLLSGDADGVIILWEFSTGDKKWRHVLQVPQPHKKGVTCITGILMSTKDAMFASSSSDGTVNIWDLVFPSSSEGDRKLSCVESLSIGPKTMVTLSLTELPGNSGHLVLAMGGLDNKIHLYCGQRSGKFVLACQLKEHTDWIRSLDFSFPVDGDGETCILLVSSSQDKGIRIWKITSRDVLANDNKSEISLISYIKGPVFYAGSSSYQISMESLLIGHEDWVYSVAWQPPLMSKENECYQPQSLLSASMDKTMMIWKPEKTTGIWINVVTVGELSHCALGFYGGHWNPSGDAILAHGYGGSFHLWKDVGVTSGDWKPQKVPSGHFAPVSDIVWAKGQEYVLSVSHDQTSRIFSPWAEKSSLDDLGNWHEIARPQVHGHDINCVTFIEGKGNHRFVSGADEKVSRVFEAPLSFLKTLNHAASLGSSFFDELKGDVQILGANMSALGLSQKPIYTQVAPETNDKNTNDGLDTLETIPEAVPVEFTEPPIEEQLSWHTLWPESHKLYGHGNELYSLCCDHKGKLVASSCKAQSASVAEIWLWQVGSWKSVGRLHSHSLTVTQMEFSRDDDFLLAVSRDRHFTVFSIKEHGPDEVSYELVTRQEAHKRIIWACSWNPFGHEFATGSRDKTVKVWGLENGSSVKLLLTLPPFKSSVTALSWMGISRQRNNGLLAVGMESGLIELWSLSHKSGDAATAACAVQFDPYMCHVSPVHRLKWKTPEKSKDSSGMQLASCGDDHCVRVFKVDLV